MESSKRAGWRKLEVSKAEIPVMIHQANGSWRCRLKLRPVVKAS